MTDDKLTLDQIVEMTERLKDAALYNETRLIDIPEQETFLKTNLVVVGGIVDGFRIQYAHATLIGLVDSKNPLGSSYKVLAYKQKGGVINGNLLASYQFNENSQHPNDSEEVKTIYIRALKKAAVNGLDRAITNTIAHRKYV